MSHVSRFKVCLYELGDGHLTADEQNRIREALRAEADRLRSIRIDVAELSFGAERGTPDQVVATASKEQL